MGQALYRRYRLRELRELVGQQHVTDVLARALDAQQVSHAYLFTGPRGIGKTTVARILAHAVNQLPYDGSTYLDIIEIDAASNRRIDDIRELRDKVHIAPVSARYKVYIIDEVHMLTTESFNALLKTLEEPPAHAIFILATTELHKVPATIVSRTQRFAFRPVPPAEVAAYLRTIADKESIAISDEALLRIAQHGEGSLRDSISLLDQLASAVGSEVTLADIEQLLGLASGQAICQLLAAVLAHQGDQALELTRQLLAAGSSAVMIAQQLITAIGTDPSSPAAAYLLLDDLLGVARSPMPDFKLLAVLAKASFAEARPARAVALAVEPLVTVQAPVLPARSVLPVVAAHEPAKSAAQPTPKRVVKKAPVAIASEAASEVDWPAVLAVVQQRYPALHSVLKRADYHYRGGVVTLSFAYALHQKKADGPAARAQLSGVIAALAGGVPDIVIQAQASTTLAAGSDAAEVAALMGGGVAINAPTV